MTVLRWRHLEPVGWRNGAGITREVAASPALPAFDWRVSIADVDSGGPFSVFPGVQRTITGIEGEGMLLTLDGAEHEVRRAVPFTFSGDATVTCRLVSGPTRNLNVMTRRHRATATVTVTQPRDVTVTHGETVLVVALSEGLTIVAGDSPPHCLEHRDSALLTEPGTITALDGALAVVRIETFPVGVP
ncbi:HutD/Ves family protein [Amycolatopsis sp. H20-H5]|uniref:HutD/Ves family protein n=1 Tax=Amycolatopsis sp. H20-H5 TaxID=3046309 RepID=UPI002DB843A6|nr:HutD family protein [Amycolatopsis sp. H20-H5]MEC3981343.1 HutD family protein [Amycolatopsis sp. H20-H5]